MNENVESKEVENKSFAQGINFYKLCWVFIIGSIIGVVVEVAYGFIVENEITRRSGVIYGPFNPVYGFGAVLITILLYKIKDKKKISIFIICMVFGACFEYFCSFFQEVAYGTVSWEYSDTFLNLRGRTNFAYSIFWGTLGLFWIKTVYPKISNIIEKIPNKAGLAITWIMIVFLVYDMGISSVASRRQMQRRNNISPQNSFEQYLDYRYNDEVLLRAYPRSIVR